MEACTKHSHERGVAACRRCGLPWCNDCLVFVYGTTKPPYCVGCAMFAAGVRTSAPLPAMSRREVRARHRAAKAAAKAARHDTDRAVSDVPPPPPPPPSRPVVITPEPAVPVAPAAAIPVAPEPVASPAAATDWSVPWWETPSQAGSR